MGLGIVGLALLGISLAYYVCRYVLGWSEAWATSTVLGFSFGASALALFAKAGGGIYTKTADISADLVGKVELGIPEDDPRNPAVIADNVGDNVGDVAGMGADLVDSYIASIVAAMILGAESGGGAFTILPVLVSAAGLFSSLIGVFLTQALMRGKTQFGHECRDFLHSWALSRPPFPRHLLLRSSRPSVARGSSFPRWRA